MTPPSAIRSPQSTGPPQRRPDRHLLALLGLIAVYTAIFATLWILRHRALFSYEFQDDAARNQMIYNTFRGRPFWSSIKGVHLAGHVSVVWAVLALPALIHPGIETACVVLTLALGLTVVPVYLVARDRLGSRGEALLLGAGFLLYAPLHAVNLHTLNAVTPAVPLLAWAFWAFQRRRFGTFLAFAVGAMLCKENIALIVAMFAFYALIQRRRWSWWVVPAAAAGLWLVIAFQVILPGTYVKPLTPTSWLVGARDSAQAGGPGGVRGSLTWIAGHPREAVGRILGPDRWLLFGQLFAPVLLVAFVSPAALLLAVPTIGQLLLHEGMLPLYHRHWIAPALPFVMLATVMGCARIKGWLVRGSSGSSPAYGLVLATVFVGCAVSNAAPNIIGHLRTSSPGWPAPPQAMQDAVTVYAPVFYRPTARSRDAWALIRQVPRQARVAASGDLLVPLSARRVLYEIPITELQWSEVDTIIFNEEPVYFGAGHYRPLSARGEFYASLRERLSTGEWVEAGRRGTIYLYRRAGSRP